MKKSVLLYCLSVLLVSCSVDKVRVEGDEINISEYDLEQYNLELQEFNFFWNQLVQNTPEETVFTDTIKGNVGFWINYKDKFGEKPDKRGYGTFHFRLTNVKHDKLYLNHGLISSACNIWCNNELVYSFGKVATTEEEAQERAKSGIVALPINNNNADIYIEVSSYSFFTGGIIRPIYIGTRNNAIAYREKKGLIEFGMLAFVFAIVLYNFIVSFFRIGVDNSYLFFAIFCLLALVRQMCLGTIPLAVWFPDFPPKIFHLIKHLGYMLGNFFAIHYFYILFKNDVNRTIMKALELITLILSVIFPVFPVSYGLTISMISQVVMALSSVYISYIIIKTINRENYESLIPLTGLILFFVFILHDVLVANYIIDGDYKQRYGFFAFAISQIAFLSIRHNKMASQLSFAKADLQKVSAFTKIQSDKEQQFLKRIQSIKSTGNSSNADELVYEIRKHIAQKEAVLSEPKITIENIDKLNAEFFHRLSTKFSDLTKSETEMCGYIRAGMDTKDIALIRNITPKSVKMARSRLRKKLNIDGSEDIYAFLSQI